MITKTCLALLSAVLAVSTAGALQAGELDIPGVKDQDYLARLQQNLDDAGRLWVQASGASLQGIHARSYTDKEQLYNAKFAKLVLQAGDLECAVNSSHFDNDETRDSRLLPVAWGRGDYLQFCQNREALLYYWRMTLIGIGLGLPQSVFGMFLDHDIVNSMRAFEKSVRDYDARISSEEMLQAGRTQASATGMQLILQQPRELHEAVVGYSLLYPYTDNVFDDPDLEKELKKRFADRLFRMLIGETPASLSSHEVKVYDMVRKVYGQYPVDRYPLIQQAMLSIFHGQKLSLALRDKTLTRREILEISLFKGGLSVLVGAFLVQPGLGERQFALAIKLGFLYQLIDDMEDMTLDHAQGQRTLFSILLESDQTADDLTSRLFDYAKRVLDEIDQFQPAGNNNLKRTILHAIRLLLLQGMAKQENKFSEEYIRATEKSSPFRFRDLRQIQFENELLKFSHRVDAQNIAAYVNRPITPELRLLSNRLTRRLN